MEGGDGEILAKMKVTKNSHRVFQLNVYELFVSEKSHIWHNIQE